MFNKEIEFSAHEDYFALEEDYPIPAKLNIPEWYKKLEHSVFNKTVKGCIPFLDALSAGYLLKMPQDFHVRHNVDNTNEMGEIFKKRSVTHNEFIYASKYFGMTPYIMGIMTWVKYCARYGVFATTTILNCCHTTR